ncbi:hypothetical protein [Actinoplanes siamensis]|uniref:Uncharacterized protein n=1 Tax=Actinoplanes siamensis TaxID=1223317 RepID=A0A919TPS9_9ACTN|nr:hypothetical protein [Actinoplanes siamensis]GIF09160.1 hypothetical protein Asi03nite_66980 [Actinoplanes siamensis]
MTVIDSRTEELVRESLAAVVGQEPDRLQRAIAAFPDNEAMTIGIRLAAGAALFALSERYNGRRPTSEETAEVAHNVVEDEGWTDVSEHEVVLYLTAAYDKARVDQVLPMDRVIIVAFVVAANLLSSHRKDDEEWWDHLDRAEAAIEAGSAL